MGAAPRLALLSFALPPALRLRRLRRDRSAGLAALAAAHRVHVVGGNLTRSPGPLVARHHGDRARSSGGRCSTRRGARPGDEVYVTGSIGARSARASRCCRTADAADAGRATACVRDRYLYPEPRVRAGVLARRAIGRRRRAWI